MTDLNVSILMKLVDAVTGPMNRMNAAIGFGADSLEKYKAKADHAFESGHHIHQTGEAVERLHERLAKLKEFPVEQATSLQATLTQLGLTARDASEGPGALNEQLTKLAAGSEFSSNKLASGLVTMKQAGLSTTDALTTLPAITAFASGHMLELSEAASLTSNVMKGFKLPAEAAVSVTDALTSAARIAGLPIADFSAAMAQLGPTSRNAGVSLTSSAAAMALLSRSGLSGAESASALNSIVTRLSGTNPRALKMTSAALKFIGVESHDAAGKLKDLPSLLAEVQGKTGKLNDSMRSRVFGALFGAGTSATVGALFKSLKPEDFAKTVEALKDVEGATEGAAHAMDQTAENAGERLHGSIDTLATVIGTNLLPGVITLKNFLADVIGATTRWAVAHPKLTRVLAVSFSTVVALTGALGTLLSIMASARAVQGVIALTTGYVKFGQAVGSVVVPNILKLTAALMTNPIVLITLAIIAAIAAITLLVVHWQKVVAIYDRFAHASLGVKIAIGVLVGPILALMSPLIAIAFVVRKIIDNWDALKNGVSSAVDAITKKLEPLVDNPVFKYVTGAAAFEAIAPTARSLFGEVADVLTGPDQETVPAPKAQKHQVGGEMRIKIDGPGRVTKMRGHGGLDLDVDAGAAMVAP